MASGIKANPVETLVGVVIRNHLSNAAALKLVAALLEVVHLKVISWKSCRSAVAYAQYSQPSSTVTYRASYNTPSSSSFLDQPLGMLSLNYCAHFSASTQQIPAR